MKSQIRRESAAASGCFGIGVVAEVTHIGRRDQLAKIERVAIVGAKRHLQIGRPYRRDSRDASRDSRRTNEIAGTAVSRS